MDPVRCAPLEYVLLLALAALVVMALFISR
jgi:hypothetical protein